MSTPGVKDYPVAKKVKAWSPEAHEDLLVAVLWETMPSQWGVMAQRMADMGHTLSTEAIRQKVQKLKRNGLARHTKVIASWTTSGKTDGGDEDAGSSPTTPKKRRAAPVFDDQGDGDGDDGYVMVESPKKKKKVAKTPTRKKGATAIKTEDDGAPQDSLPDL